MKEKFKQAFEKYYENLCKIYSDVFDSQPTISYGSDDAEIDSEIDADMIISQPNEDGESAWKLKEVGDYDFSEIENELGFNLNEELKAFYSSYLFLHLAGDYSFGDKSDSGETEIATLYFDMLKSKNSIKQMVIIASKNGKYYFGGDSEVFLIGSAIFNDDDSYNLFYDNEFGRVFIYESDTENKIELSSSLFEVISNFEAIL